MSARRAKKRTPVVPLEAGAGPQNPPCPACGEPLFGWVEERPGLAGPVRRCESCGLGAVGEVGGPEEALRELGRLGDDRGVRIANRAGFSASLGGAGWAGLERGSRYLFTPEAVRRLVARRDQVVRSARWSPGRGLALMWQTILNSATFGQDLVVGTATKSARTWKRRIDWLTVVALAVPALLLAIPLELAGAISGRGSVYFIEAETL